MSDQEKQRFSVRWARRKQKVKEEGSSADSLSEEVQIDPVKDDETGEPTREQQIAQLNELTDADMPDLDTLDEEADFSGFMSKGVSDRLRQMALKKLFHGASYNLRDGLDEYDDDYTFFEKLDPNTITADMKHMMQVEAEKERKLLEEQALQDELALEEAQELEGDGSEQDSSEVLDSDSDTALESADADAEVYAEQSDEDVDGPTAAQSDAQIDSELDELDNSAPDNKNKTLH